MKKILLLLITVLMFSCSKDSGSIIGDASTSEGVVANITVKLYSEDANLLETTQTDNDGNFAFTNLSEGNYYVAATITINDEIWDTGTTPNLFYVGGEIEKKVSLSLSKK